MQVGVIVPNLGYSQLSFTLLHQVHKLSKDIKNTAIIFQKDIVPPYLIHMCAVVNLAEVYSFKGLLVTTSFADAQIALKNAKMAKDIILYPWDLDWLRGEKNFLENYKLLKAVKVVTQNEYHAKAIEQYAGITPAFNVEHLDIQKIVKLYETQQS